MKGPTVHPHLYRQDQDLAYYTDLYWSGVGPGHQRASYLLHPLLDVYQERGGSRFVASNGFGFRHGNRMPERTFATMAAAKRAARAWFLGWLARTGEPIRWETASTGVHFLGIADGFEVGTYYHCPQANGPWHKGFRAHFGATYFGPAISTPEQAKEAIAATWAVWLQRTRTRFLTTCLVANKVERQAGADELPAGELASVPACIPAGERDSG